MTDKFCQWELQWYLKFSQLLSQLFSTHLHLFSRHPTSSQLFSPLLSSSYLFSALVNSFRLFSSDWLPLYLMRAWADFTSSVTRGFPWKLLRAELQRNLACTHAICRGWFAKDCRSTRHGSRENRKILAPMRKKSRILETTFTNKFWKEQNQRQNEKHRWKSPSQPWFSHFHTVYDAQLRKTLELRTYPQHQMTLDLWCSHPTLTRRGRVATCQRTMRNGNRNCGSKTGSRRQSEQKVRFWRHVCRRALLYFTVLFSDSGPYSVLLYSISTVLCSHLLYCALL